MEISLILRKYKIEIGDDSLPAQDLITFSLLNSWNLSDDLMEDVIITRQLESDAIFNFAVSSVALTLSGSDTLTSEFTRENLEQYTYEIKVYGNSVCRFIGYIDQSNIRYNQDFQTWEIKARDWYKFFYDTLSNVAWNYLSGNLRVYLESTFGIGIGKPIEFLEIDTPYSNPTAQWSDAGVNVENLIEHKLLSRTDYLFEVIKHYGAFLYVDANGILHFKNRNRKTPPSYAVSIDDLVLDKVTTKTYLRDSYYDGVLVSQKTIISPTQSEISWKLLRYVNGEMEVTTITDPDQLNQIRGLRVLDIRQKLGAIASGAGSDITYTWGYRMGFEIYPQREYEETLKDYQDLFRRPILLETEIEHSDDIGLLTNIFYTDPFAVEYQVEYIEEDLVNEKMLIRAKEYFNPNIVP